MFDPTKAKKDKEEKAAKAKVINQLRDWSLTIIPIEHQVNMDLDIREVICGDPTCAPIDTVFTMIWPSGGKGIFALPTAPNEISQDELIENFPNDETIAQWKEGIKAPWPPRPELRFDIGARVECRIGPHPVKGWAPGRIVRLYYSEPNWPANMVAPYQIALHDGRLIFAPQDTDQVIRLRPPAAPDAPSSPEIDYNDYDDVLLEGEEEDMDMGDENEGGRGDDGDNAEDDNDDELNSGAAAAGSSSSGINSSPSSSSSSDRNKKGDN